MRWLLHRIARHDHRGGLHLRTEPSDDHRGMLHAAMRTYCRLLAANRGPTRALVVESLACPAIRKVRAECLTAWAQLMEALVAKRRPDRPAGAAAIGAVVHRLATAIEAGRDLSSMSGILADTAYRLLLA